MPAKKTASPKPKPAPRRVSSGDDAIPAAVTRYSAFTELGFKQTIEILCEETRRHISRIEALILVSFTQLLRKTGLVSAIRIDPASFELTLTGGDGLPLAFDKLSAGERQLLATSLLWGLARASGRPIPTVIDTPLGRLDSTHRQHLVERYFLVAAHQVILLSTDDILLRQQYSFQKQATANHYLFAA